MVAWQNAQQPFVATAGGPNPSVAAVLGIIPGVGAMYNGQYFKGLIHVVIFVVIISITTHYGLFGLFIPAWVLYQSFEAFHTAKAIRDGQPIPEGDLLFITPDGTRGPDPAKITGGKYELKTTAGKKRVEISASKIRPGGARGAGGEPVAEEYVPARYNIQSELTADVQAKAKNTFDFELGSK